MILWFLTVFISFQFIEAKWSFAVISDVHMGETPLRRGYLNAAATEIRELRSKFNISFIIITGDVTDKGIEEQYDDAKEILKASGVDFFVLPGNHDVNKFEFGQINFRDSFGYYLSNYTEHYTGFEMQQVGTEIFYLHNYQFRHEGIVFLALDWNSRKQDEGKYGCVQLFNYTFHWLEQRLQEIATDDSVQQIVFLQHEPYTFAWQFSIGNVLRDQSRVVFSDYQLERIEKLIRSNLPSSALRRKFYGVLAGHLHVWDVQFPFSPHYGFEHAVQFQTKACKVSSAYAIFEVGDDSKISRWHRESARAFKIDFVIAEIVTYFVFGVHAIYLFLERREKKWRSYIKVFAFVVAAPVYFFLFMAAISYFFRRNFEQGFLLNINLGYNQTVFIPVSWTLFLFFCMEFTDFYFIWKKTSFSPTTSVLKRGRKPSISIEEEKNEEDIGYNEEEKKDSNKKKKKKRKFFHKCINVLISVEVSKPLCDATLFILFYFLMFYSYAESYIIAQNYARPPDTSVFQDGISVSFWLAVLCFWFAFFTRNFHVVSKLSRKYFLRKFENLSYYNRVRKIENSRLIEADERMSLLKQDNNEEQDDDEDEDIDYGVSMLRNVREDNKRKHRCISVFMLVFDCNAAIILIPTFSFFVVLISFLIIRGVVDLVAIVFARDEEYLTLVQSITNNILCYFFFSLGYFLVAIFAVIDSLRTSSKRIKEKNNFKYKHFLILMFMGMYNIWFFVVANIIADINFNPYLGVVEFVLGIPLLLSPYIVKGLRYIQIFAIRKIKERKV